MSKRKTATLEAARVLAQHPNTTRSTIIGPAPNKEVVIAENERNPTVSRIIDQMTRHQEE